MGLVLGELLFYPFSIHNLVDDVSVFVVFCSVPRVTVKLEESFRAAELLGEKVGLILSLI
jgi:hypothetical protein